jgi:sugar/nucleoside kinase (ribokinase family)
MPNGNFIKQYRRQLIDLLPHLDILILHERSMIPFFLTKDNEDIVKIAKKHGIMIVYTQGARGATLITPTEVLSLSAHDVPQSKIIDKSGAQAAFAAGLLYSLNQGFSLQEAGNNGILLAEYVLQHVDYELVDEDVLYALSRKNKENSQ